MDVAAREAAAATSTSTTAQAEAAKARTTSTMPRTRTTFRRSKSTRCDVRAALVRFGADKLHVAALLCYAGVSADLRQCDRIVAIKCSPILSKKFNPMKSAGPI